MKMTKQHAEKLATDEELHGIIDGMAQLLDRIMPWAEKEAHSIRKRMYACAKVPYGIDTIHFEYKDFKYIVTINGTHGGATYKLDGVYSSLLHFVDLGQLVYNCICSAIEFHTYHPNVDPEKRKELGGDRFKWSFK